MAHSTLRRNLIDRLHEQDSDRATRYILAQTPNAPTSPALTVRGILRDYAFAPVPSLTLYQNGVCVQCALSMTGELGRFIVTCNADGWQAECPAFGHDLGYYFIAAAQQRVKTTGQQGCTNCVSSENRTRIESTPMTTSTPMTETKTASQQADALTASLNGLVPEEDQTDEDFTYMLHLAEALYPPLRKFYKRDRANTYFDDRSNFADVPLYRAFRLLLGLMEQVKDDPACVDRFRAQLGDLELTVQQRKADQAAAKG